MLLTRVVSVSVVRKLRWMGALSVGACTSGGDDPTNVAAHVDSPSEPSSQESGQPTVDASVDATGSSSAGNAGDGGSSTVAEPPDWRSLTSEPGEHRYSSLSDLCCAKGEGRACCEEYGLLTHQCHEHGGSSGACRGDGESWPLDDPCTHCCAGLRRKAMDEPDSVGGCIRRGFFAEFFCACVARTDFLEQRG